MTDPSRYSARHRHPEPIIPKSGLKICRSLKPTSSIPIPLAFFSFAPEKKEKLKTSFYQMTAVTRVSCFPPRWITNGFEQTVELSFSEPLYFPALEHDWWSAE